MNILHDLSIDPTYSFKFNNSDEFRFFLVFGKNNEINNLDDQDVIFAYTSDDRLNVSYYNQDNKPAELSIYNLTGQKIVSEIRLINGTYSYKLDVSPGIYFVKVQNEDRVYNRKVFFNE